MRRESQIIRMGNDLLDWMDKYSPEASEEQIQRCEGKLEIVCWMLHLDPLNVQTLRVML